MRLHIVIAEPSVIIRSGLVAVLRRLPSLDIDIAEIADMSQLNIQLKRYRPNILIVNPSNIGTFYFQQLKKDSEFAHLKMIALQCNLMDNTLLKGYDGVISLYDGADILKDKFAHIMRTTDNKEQKQGLSEREKEIVVCVVKGLTNKQIAEELFLSTHTIMTHRRNIAGKLQIHSPSGLTIYAIVNKLVDLDDVKDGIYSEE